MKLNKTPFRFCFGIVRVLDKKKRFGPVSNILGPLAAASECMSSRVNCLFELAVEYVGLILFVMHCFP